MQTTAILGGLLSCMVAAALAAAVVTCLQWLAHSIGGQVSARLLHASLFAAIGVLLSEGLLVLWPVLAPWRHVVLGGSLGLVWAAMRPSRPRHRHTAAND